MKNHLSVFSERLKKKRTNKQKGRKNGPKPTPVREINSISTVFLETCYTNK